MPPADAATLRQFRQWLKRRLRYAQGAQKRCTNKPETGAYFSGYEDGVLAVIEEVNRLGLVTTEQDT